MSDPAQRLEPIESPCISVCRLDEQGRCMGCFRTSSEIAGWLSMTVEERRAVIAELPERAEQLFGD
ncbi:DUF1289 domain-containing protein [Wenzhouxiangella sp. XN79A]|uniref:DUF1289 domain-containing protein n=1 Tax=Wenzhouxiangella sp. XN79A TaxID=2724193 RepID=UPI00144ABF41|nr:DUF1289 domain-containing protein [Wenzhouxiangella sp. XN79A]NKI35954.1 DUF1289 domain-containing protein [Wenzhouxiangella sp. XN79A]